MTYKDNYKSIQINLLRDKHNELIEWIESRSDREERSLNSIIIQILKEEYERFTKENKK